MMTPSSLGALRNELWIVWYGAEANCVVFLSDVPVRLGPKDLSYLGDVFRPAPAGWVGAPPSRDPVRSG